MKYILCFLTILLQITPVAAGREGGGGDALEARVNEIRDDILKWILDGGSFDLRLPAEVSRVEYDSKMRTLLAPKFVVVGFVEDDRSPDEELRVNVDSQPKTCRGFYSIKDKRPHILCNISRFRETSESDQYMLIHHEYAGLAYLEKNDGAASDYSISSQITDYLVVKNVLRLAFKGQKSTWGFKCSLHSIELPLLDIQVRDGLYSVSPLNVERTSLNDEIHRFAGYSLEGGKGIVIKTSNDADLPEYLIHITRREVPRLQYDAVVTTLATPLEGGEQVAFGSCQFWEEFNK